ncbi:recombinase family protein [Streptomyces sp. NPDC059443]|uniref:recombinase family protein n=1 Tax=unclassified Streptomyces TaxID=2593676 RepID=UPI00368681A1
MRDSTLPRNSKASGSRGNKTENGVLQVVIYLRVSTKAQSAKSGLKQQEQDCRAWLDCHLRDTPYEIVGVFVDDGVSGKRDQRDDKALIEQLVRDGKVDLAIAQKLDRYGRTVRIINDWIWEMVDKGTRVVTSDDRIDSADASKFKVDMPVLAYLAELEHEMIFSRTWNGRERKLQAGGWAGGPPPYGFELLNKGQSRSIIALCEGEVHILVTAAHCLIDLELNYSETCDYLNKNKMFTRSGRPWTVGNLAKRLGGEPILELYVTYRKEGGKTAVDEDGNRKYGVAVKIPMPEIFDVERRAQLRAAIEKLGFESRRENSLYPLSTRIKGNCGEVYIGGGVRRDETRVYRCKGTAHRCDDVYLDAGEVEDAVWGQLARLLDDRTLVKGLAKEGTAPLPASKERYEERVVELRAQVTEKKLEVSELMRRSVKFRWDDEATEEALSGPNMELESLRKTLREAEGWLEGYEQTQAMERGQPPLGAQPRLDTPDLEEKAELFRLFDVQVKVENHRFKKKAGARCPVTEWHVATKQDVPADVVEEEWAGVRSILETIYSPASFTKTKIDLRLALNGMLHRLRTGITWNEMPMEFGTAQRIRERQLSWWHQEAWPLLVEWLNEQRAGTPVYVHPPIPPLRVMARAAKSRSTPQNT